MIDICDFAVGLSRQLYGLTIASERPGHRMMETWHPLGGRRDLAPSNSRSRCGRGTPASPSSAAMRWCGSRRKDAADRAGLCRDLSQGGEAVRRAPKGCSLEVSGGKAVGEALTR
jgi:hypothetical protein